MSEGIVLAAAESACAMANHARFTKLVKLELEMSGKTLLGHVQNDDQPGTFVPLEVQSDEGWERGSILTLQDRAIITSWRGTLKFTHRD